ncbi:MAG: ethanolamine utilization cobalamin adenosyltransferase [Clostridiales bacterium]|jgi:ethanolamine utilization cobalamin adenosyltransferase|nr:ethanolamine utilization cobalamin adenosyltransferase [Clostridiales bacterium]MDK2933088.1 ethanolamine utilization cobalamin adenosyltransferase [Clostridiales bacterium]
MKVLTETVLRAEFKHKAPAQYFVNPDVLITPSARQYLRDKNVKLVIQSKEQSEQDKKKCAHKHEMEYEELKTPEHKIIPKYISYYSGGIYEKKPEHMTQIHGNKLVYKDHPRIILRGKLDSFQSEILTFQILADAKGEKRLVEELEDVLIYIREILRAEVLNEDLNKREVIGLNEEQLREMSHHPKKYFGIGHILPNYEMGEIMIGLNSLRSSVREVEIAAVTAFKKECEVERLGIIRALNRLSSCIYIIMCKYKAGLYK